MLYAIDWFYIKVWSPSISFLTNSLIWLVFFYKWPMALKRKRDFEIKVYEINRDHQFGDDLWPKIDKLLKTPGIEYKADKFDWTPWVITYFLFDMKDDCDGYTAFTVWLLKLFDIESKVWHLRGKKNGHAICVVSYKDRMAIRMISNGKIFYLPDGDVLNFYRGLYSFIIK